jgi:predicted Zn-dependent peptidase
MHLLERDPRRILQRLERADSLSVENIHAAIRKYFPAERRTVVSLMPEIQGSGGTVPASVAPAR